MIKQKKKLSIALNKVIEPLIKENKDFVKLVRHSDYILYFVDSDPESDFHFGITKETSDGNGHMIHYSWKPHNSQINTGVSSASKLEGFGQHFKGWLSNIEYYNQESILDDPILNGYEKEFFDDFRIIEEDADYAPFNYIQQLLIDQFLSNISEHIGEFRNENNSYLIDEITSDAQSIQASITTEAKNPIMKRLSGLFAKARKSGLKVSNYVIKEFIKEVCTKGADWTFNYMVSNSEKISGYIHHLVNALSS